METREDHRKLRDALESKKIKNLSVVGMNMESLELISTIRREFPKVRITVVDDNRESALACKYGKEVEQALIK